MKKTLLGIAIALGLVFSVSAQILAGYTTTSYQWILHSLIDSTPIGSNYPSTGVFTLITGPLTGNVTGNLTGNVAGNLTGNVTGNVTGNSTTATALASTPTNCGVNNVSYGIQANGKALCRSTTYLLQAMTIAANGCSTGGAEQFCTVPTATWPVAFADNGYVPECGYVGLASGGANAGMYGPYVVGWTATNITIEVQSGSNSAGGSAGSPAISCFALHN